MSRRRTTFGKLERDRAKQAKNRAKQEKRAERAEEAATAEATPETSAADEARILESLAKLHEAFARGDVTLDDFETRREELTRSLNIT
jgi:uncharacterized membrane protein